MAGTTIKGVGNDGNVQIRDMVTAAKQNAGTGSRQCGTRPRTMRRRPETMDARPTDVTMSDAVNHYGPVTDSGITSPEHRKSQMSKQRIVTPKIWKKSRKSWEPSYRT